MSTSAPASNPAQRQAARHPATAAAGALLLLLSIFATGCAPVPAKPAAPTTLTLAELMQRPAERALIEGIRYYDEGQYEQAEIQLRRALAAGLNDGPDRASAHKLLAFISCTSERMSDCATQFSAARAADPSFQLSRSESGHPVWGPVYRKVVGP